MGLSGKAPLGFLENRHLVHWLKYETLCHYTVTHTPVCQNLVGGENGRFTAQPSPVVHQNCR